jgi:hypothetical protein
VKDANHINVPNGLARVPSDVDADVITSGTVKFIQPNIGAVEKRNDGNDFIHVKVKEGFNVPPGYDERVGGVTG